MAACEGTEAEFGGVVYSRDTEAAKVKTQPYLIVASQRSGGTFLAHVLSNHPQVFCDRGESWHGRSSWRQTMNVSREEIARAMFSQQFYYASGFKVNWPRPDWKGLSSPVIQEMGPRIIFLVREDKVRQAISILYLKAGRREHSYADFPVHSHYGERPAFRTEIDPERVTDWRNRFEKIEKASRRAIVDSGLSWLEISYEEMTGGKNVDCIAAEVAQTLCEFLGVANRPLCAELEKLAPPDLSDVVKNWHEIKQVAYA